MEYSQQQAMDTCKGNKHMKTCPNCEELLPMTAFWNHPHAADGKQTNCIECCTDMQRARRRKHNAKQMQVNELMRRWKRASPQVRQEG